MRKALALALLLCLPLFGGCDGAAPSAAASATASAPAQTETAAPATPTPTPELTPTPTPEPTPTPMQSGVYPGEVYEYFARVGFAGGSADAPAIAKWTVPIRIQAAGKPNGDDMKALSALVAVLKEIPGAPGVSYVTAGGNFLLYFLPKAGASGVEGYDGAENSYFAAQWEGSPRAVILIADEMTAQPERDAALASSFLRALGLMADADGQYADSVLNLKSGAAHPSERDLRLLKLLYSAELTPGTAKADAMAVLPALNPEASRAALGRDARLNYFNEVGFYWKDKAREGIVSKWASPIRLEIQGELPPELKIWLDDAIIRLSRIEGFPGIAMVESGGNFVVTFAARADIARSYSGMAAAEACAWKPTRGKNGAISACRIGVADDFADAGQRVSQFLRVFIWSLGLNFTSDTVPDSILNLNATAQEWSAMDWAMVETLYGAGVKVGAKRPAVMSGLIKSMK